MKNQKKFSGEKKLYVAVIICFCVAILVLAVKTNKMVNDLSAVSAVVIHDVTLTKKEDRDKKIVYITPSGSKYHLDGCSYLGENKISVTKGEAIKSGFESCSKCQP